MKTTRTVRERLAATFAALTATGWFANGDWQCCQGHGFDAAVKEKPNAKAYCFFDRDEGKKINRQGALTKPLPIFFAAGKTKDYQSDAQVGEALRAALQLEGLAVKWDGNPNHCVIVAGVQEVS